MHCEITPANIQPQSAVRLLPCRYNEVVQRGNDRPLFSTANELTEDTPSEDHE